MLRESTLKPTALPPTFCWSPLGAGQPPTNGIMHFHNGRGTHEQWIGEDKHALEWMRLSYREFKGNTVRLDRFVLAYNLGNFQQRLVLPVEMAQWSLPTLHEKLVKTGARLTRHARRVILQMAEVPSRETYSGSCRPSRASRVQTEAGLPGFTAGNEGT